MIQARVRMLSRTFKAHILGRAHTRARYYARTEGTLMTWYSSRVTATLNACLVQAEFGGSKEERWISPKELGMRESWPNTECRFCSMTYRMFVHCSHRGASQSNRVAGVVCSRWNTDVFCSPYMLPNTASKLSQPTGRPPVCNLCKSRHR